MSSYQDTLDHLKSVGFNVTPGSPATFGGAVKIELKGVSVELPLSYAKELAGWIMGVGQKVNNKLSD